MFKLPLVKKQEISLEDIQLIGYDKVNQSDDHNKIVHFFLDDYWCLFAGAGHQRYTDSTPGRFNKL